MKLPDYRPGKDHYQAPNIEPMGGVCATVVITMICIVAGLFYNVLA